MVLSQLKLSLEQKIGFAISSIAACRRLESILINQAHYVSYTTLSRMFGLASIQAKTRSSTLDELARFLGYQNYGSFLLIYNEVDTFQKLNLEHQLKLETLLISGKERQAIDHILMLRNIYPSVYKQQTQSLAMHFFGKEKPAMEGIDYLLNSNELSLELFQHFVFEDDPYGHFSRTMVTFNKENQNNLEFGRFQNLFTLRKSILQGKAKINFPKITYDTHFHLISRTYELELLLNKLTSKKIHSRTDEILHRMTDWKETDFALAFVGRWCRGLIYTEQYQLLKLHVAWKEQCIALLQIREINQEFQAVIYSFLVLTYGIHGSLTFMYQGNWENAKIESKLLLSLAFKQNDAFRTYKHLLGYV